MFGFRLVIVDSLPPECGVNLHSRQASGLSEVVKLYFALISFLLLYYLKVYVVQPKQSKNIL